MAQVREIEMPTNPLGALPGHLTPITSNPDSLTSEEKGDFAAFHAYVATGAPHPEDTAFMLYLEQRRRTRSFLIGGALAAAALGGLMGYFVGKEKK